MFIPEANKIFEEVEINDFVQTNVLKFKDPADPTKLVKILMSI